MDELKQITLNETSLDTNTFDNQTKEIPMQPATKSKLVLFLIISSMILGGVTGFYYAQKKLLLASDGGNSSGNQALTSTTTVKVGDIFGSSDEKTFRDQAEGILMTGGIEGEGSHHLERGANKTQWVYVTSSVVDLDLLVGHRVTIWGETNQGKKAGWLMDVGRLKVLELNVASAVDQSGSQD